MYYLVVVIAVIVGAVWWFGLRPGHGSVDTASTSDASTVNDHELAKRQADFERHMVEEQDLPDGIRGRTAYIYWNLMRNWFKQLNAARRYDDTQAQQLRRDWCDYLELLSLTSTSRFLALEAESSEKASAYSEEANLASQRIEFIQDAFATAVGAEAIEELQQVRSREANAFDRTGTQPIAPIDYHYFTVSINPYIEKCQPVLPGTPGEA